MELSAQLMSLRGNLSLNWLPRLQNTEADQLANGDSHLFSAANRVRIGFAGHLWLLPQNRLVAGRGLYSDIRKQRQERTAVKLRKVGRQVRLVSFREANPWK